MSPDLREVVAVVLAGGFGTRVQHLLPDLPKPMAPVCGRPFVEWVIRYLANQGITQVILSTGCKAEVCEKHFQPQPVPGVRIQCVPETTPMGTAGGFLHAINASQEEPPAWLVCNGDSLVFANLGELAQTLVDPDVGGSLLGLPVPDASRFGSLSTSPDGYLLSFREKQPGPGLINAGVYLLRHDLLQPFAAKSPLGFERDVFPALLSEGIRLKVCPTSAPFLDMGTPETLPMTERFIEENRNQFLAP